MTTVLEQIGREGVAAVAAAFPDILEAARPAMVAEIAAIADTAGAVVLDIMHSEVNP